MEAPSVQGGKAAEDSHRGSESGVGVGGADKLANTVVVSFESLATAASSLRCKMQSSRDGSSNEVYFSAFDRRH